MESRNQQSGFSLLEIMVALVVMAIGLMGLLGISTMAIRAADDNDRWTTARVLAQSRLERLTGPVHQTVSLTNAAASTGSETVQVEGTPYTINWSYNSIGASSTDPIAVSVFVNYPNSLTGVTMRTVKSFFL